MGKGSLRKSRPASAFRDSGLDIRSRDISPKMRAQSR